VANPKRVLFIVSFLRKNGAILSTLTTIKHLDRTRFEPHLFVVQRRGEAWAELLEGLPITYGSETGERPDRVFRRLLGCARRADVLVGGLEMAPTFWAVVMGKLTGKPSVGFVRNSLPEHLARMPGRYKGLTKLIYPGLTRVVAISSGIKESVEALVPGLKGRVSVVYIPLDVAGVKRRAEEPVPEAAPFKPHIVAVGRLEYQKGFDVLLRAYAALRENPDLPNLVILGEGREEAKLKALVEELGLTERVFMPGFQGNPYAWMRGAELFVSSSRYEGFCRVIAEALAVGTPVVATDCPSGPAEVLQGGRCGVLVPNEDAPALAEGIRRALTDGALRRQFQACGEARAEDFAPEVTVRSFEGVLARLL